jgi:multicomponent Na+:H+ antiporter subunit G
MSEIIGTIFIVIGLVFDIAGCIGLIRLPDVYNRLQATTKSITLGTCSILLGAFIIKGFTGIGVKSVLCIMLLLLTAPAAAHALARAADISKIKAWEKKDALS